MRSVAAVALEGEDPIEGGRPRKARVVTDHGAGRHAHAAADALDGAVDRAALARVRSDLSKTAVLGGAPTGNEDGAHAEHLVLDGRHVHDQVADEREVVERTDGHRPPRKPREQRPAGPALAAIDDHAAGAAHADATGVAEGEGGIRPALYLDERVEHGHALTGPHPVLLQALAHAGSPAKDSQYHRQPQKRANAAPPQSRASNKRRRCQRAGNPKSRRMERRPKTPCRSTSPRRAACTVRRNGFLRCRAITARRPTAATRWTSHAHMPALVSRHASAEFIRRLRIFPSRMGPSRRLPRRSGGSRPRGKAGRGARARSTPAAPPSRRRPREHCRDPGPRRDGRAGSGSRGSPYARARSG